MKLAESALRENAAACALVCKDGTVVHSEKSGVQPLLGWLGQAPDLLKDACIADKVVGKAAAMLMHYGGVNEVYAELISDAAVEYLEQAHIPYQFSEKAPYILNRPQTGMCPMEQKCMGLTSPDEAYVTLKNMVEGMRHGNH